MPVDSLPPQRSQTFTEQAFGAAAWAALGVFDVVFPVRVEAALKEEREAPSIEDLRTQYPGLKTAIESSLKESLEIFIAPEFIDYDVLDTWMKEQSEQLFIKIARKKGQVRGSLEDYTLALQDILLNQLHAKFNLQHQATTSLRDYAPESMTNLWKSFTDAKKVALGFMDQIADAHGFIQAIGWSTQNENSLFAIIDAYNYLRYYSAIAEYRDILYGLLAPLFPIYYEYRHIALHETNVLFKVTRALIPMLIVAGVIVAAGAFLAPYAIPELAFAFLCVPLLYLGLALASLYISVKDVIYQEARRFWYGGTYQLPEFQQNERLNLAFGDQADPIRNYYINALKACDDIEADYAQYENLSSEEQTLRNDNKKRRQTLVLEWFDIHENKKIAYDETRPIVQNRLKQDRAALWKTFGAKYKNDEADIKNHVKDIKSDLETRIPQAHKNASLKKSESEGTPEASKPASSDARLRFFPSSAVVREELCNIQKIEAALTTA